MANPHRQPLAQKLARHRVIQDGCWQWSGAKHPFGYGWIRHGRSTLLAHRVAYEIAHGPLPLGVVVRHGCDNPECTNPDHLVAGTHADNVADKIAKGRHLVNGRACNVKMTDAQVAQVPELRARGLTWAEIAKQFSLSRRTVRTRMASV